MPKGEEMFKMHGYSGSCPEPPLIPAWLVRVKAELEQLDERISKLQEFCRTEAFTALDDDEQRRMQRQAALMLGYAIVLRERIKAAEAS
jgi:hypothetical protein